MLSIVMDKPVSVKIGIVSIHYRIKPLTIRMLYAAEHHSNRWLYSQLIVPEGIISAILKPFLSPSLYAECEEHIKLSSPDDLKDGGDVLTPEGLMGIAAFIPNLAYHYKWNIDEIMDMTMRDAIWFSRYATHHENQRREFDVGLVGGKTTTKSTLELDGRYSKVKTEKISSKQFAALQQAVLNYGVKDE